MNKNKKPNPVSGDLEITLWVIGLAVFACIAIYAVGEILTQLAGGG